MNLIYLIHPAFSGNQSMIRIARMYSEGMKEKGHTVDVWQPEPRCYNWSNIPIMKKYLSYIDQYLLFPKAVKRRMKSLPKETLYILIDQALAPWVPLVKDKPHVLHCNDFMAQFSALGKIPGQQTSFSGKIYQWYIRRGIKRAQNIITISQQTKTDYLKLFPDSKANLECIYLGLDNSFAPFPSASAREKLGERLNRDLSAGYLLHVGGNQWYKNRTGAVELYNAWRTTAKEGLPLVLIGIAPDQMLKEKIDASPYRNDIITASGLPDNYLQLAYSGACLFLFPSLSEGFGWPIAESLACGCQALTTNRAPMTEVGGDVVIYLDHPDIFGSIQAWALQGAKKIEDYFSADNDQKAKIRRDCLVHAQKFSRDYSMAKTEERYRKILDGSLK